MTLGAVFNPHRNSLNALRLAFATMVIVAHSWPLTGRTEPTGVGEYNEFGAWAVSGFFVISGYLITMSRDRTPIGTFLWRRFLRIYPAFLVVLLVTAFVLAPLSTLVMGNYSFLSGVTYVVRNLGLYMFRFDVHGTLGQAPYPAAWDGSLWTLFYEALCYVLIGLLMSMVARRWLGPVLWATVVLGMAFTALHTYVGTLQVNDMIVHAVRLGTYFAAGAIVYVYRDRVPYKWRWAGVAAALVIATVATGTFSFLGALPLAYLCLWAGTALPLQRVGAKNDISYGMYIYAFPVQQMLAITVGLLMPLWLFMLMATAITVPLAWGSWMAVERPAMRLKRLARSAYARERQSAPTVARVKD